MNQSFPQRGCCYWVRIPGEPKNKKRPALVISPDIRNQLANDVLLLPLTSILKPAPTHVRLRKGEAGLPQPSMVKCEQITTLKKDRLSSKSLGGHLSAGRLQEIELAILRAIGVAVY